jgi:hypothetical protein
MDDQAMRPAVIFLMLLLVLPGTVLSAQQASQTVPTGSAPPANGATTNAAPSAVATSTPAPAPAPVDKTPLQQRPYRVTVEVGFSGPEAVDPQLRADIVRQIRHGFDRMCPAAQNLSNALLFHNWKAVMWKAKLKKPC